MGQASAKTKSSSAGKKGSPPKSKQKPTLNKGTKAGKSGKSNKSSVKDKAKTSSASANDMTKPIKKRKIKAVMKSPPPRDPSPEPAPEPEPEVEVPEIDVVEEDEAPERCSMGLKIGWWIKLKNGESIPVHSVRDMANTLCQKGVNVGKVEALRAFIRRRCKGVKVRQVSYAPFESVESITRASEPENNLLAGRMETVPEEMEM